MAIYVRPFVRSITHTEGCEKRHCGPACARVTDGWEYDIRLKLPNGVLFEERKKSPVKGAGSENSDRGHSGNSCRSPNGDAVPDKKAARGAAKRSGRGKGCTP